MSRRASEPRSFEPADRTAALERLGREVARAVRLPPETAYRELVLEQLADCADAILGGG